MLPAAVTAERARHLEEMRRQHERDLQGGAGHPLSPQAKFCPECSHPTPSAVQAATIRCTSPEGYTPKHLAEKILTSKAALEGERKQVTVLFADLKGSMELLADRDPEEARKLLDPVIERSTSPPPRRCTARAAPTSSVPTSTWLAS
jgi:hypothetical protein